MANLVRKEFMQFLGKKQIDLENDPLAVYLMDPAYTYSAAHDRVDDISASALAGPVNLSNVVVNSDGTVSADDTVFSGIAASEQIESIWIAYSTGVASTSVLGVFIDVGDGLTGDDVPITTDGNNVTIEWPSGVVFTL